MKVEIGHARDKKRKMRNFFMYCKLLVMTLLYVVAPKGAVLFDEEASCFTS